MLNVSALGSAFRKVRRFRPPLNLDVGQITRSVFYGECPIVTVYPFGIDSPLGSVPVTFRLRTYFSGKRVTEALDVAVVSVGGYKVQSGWVSGVTESVVLFLWVAYDEVVRQWVTFVLKSMKGICNDPGSRNMWALMKSTLPPLKDVTTEFALWSLWNMSLDKEADTRVWMELRDSLLPWLQPELYQKWKEKGPPRRNIAYGRQREELLAGTEEGLDVVE